MGGILNHFVRRHSFALAIVLGFQLFATAVKADSFNEWVSWQRQKAADYLIPNLSPDGTAPGTVVAATSKSDPDYWFHWIRDAGIVVQAAILEFEGTQNSDHKKHLAKFLLDFVDLSRRNQLSNTLSGMGEPKFHVNGDPFNGPWGRPQNDGPALRAIALVQLADVWIKAGKMDWVKTRLYDGKIPTHTTLKADLEFVAYHWQETCFDLWEEVKGKHVYSRMAMRRALLDGAWLADRLDDSGAAAFYRKQAGNIERELEWHWAADKGTLIPTIDRDGGLDYKHAGIDASVVISALHGATPDGKFGVTDDKMLSTFERVLEANRTIYGVNKGNAPGVAIGRYPEDQYNGGEPGFPGGEGNPWFLLTTGYAEFLYRSAAEFEKKGSFSINSINERFFKWLGIDSGSSVSQLAAAMRSRGDSFLARVKFHGGDDGRLPEQFNRHSGFRQGAKDLTWSNAAFITAIDARR